jgi:hypothetical protein
LVDKVQGSALNDTVSGNKPIRARGGVLTTE